MLLICHQVSRMASRMASLNGLGISNPGIRQCTGTRCTIHQGHMLHNERCTTGCSGPALPAGDSGLIGAADCPEGGNKASEVASGDGNTAAGGGSSSAAVAVAEASSEAAVAAAAERGSPPAPTSEDLRPLTMVDMKEAMKQVPVLLPAFTRHMSTDDATSYLRSSTPGSGTDTYFPFRTNMKSSLTFSITPRRHQGESDRTYDSSNAV